jgi:hypothetical protein
MIEGTANFPKMDGKEIQPGITLIGEPSPVAGTNKLRCLANVLGALCVVELSIRFGGKDGEEKSSNQA